MKSSIILFVALTMLVKPLWPVAEYIMNYDYISNVLCENKDKPKLKCDGKCYLVEMLAKESEQQGKNPFGHQQNKIETVHPICFQSFLDYDLTTLSFPTTKKPITYIKKLFSSPHLLDLIQPPRFS